MQMIDFGWHKIPFAKEIHSSLSHRHRLPPLHQKEIAESAHMKGTGVTEQDALHNLCSTALVAIESVLASSSGNSKPLEKLATLLDTDVATLLHDVQHSVDLETYGRERLVQIHDKMLITSTIYEGDPVSTAITASGNTIIIPNDAEDTDFCLHNVGDTCEIAGQMRHQKLVAMAVLPGSTKAPEELSTLVRQLFEPLLKGIEILMENDHSGLKTDPVALILGKESSTIRNELLEAMRYSQLIDGDEYRLNT